MRINQNLFTIDDLKQDLQLTLYQLAVQDIWHLPVEKLTLYHLRTNTPCSCEARETAQLEAARQTVLEVAESIAAGNFPATEHQYCPCDFPEHCPYYRQQYPALAPETARQDMLPGLAAEDAVEKYVTLQSEIKDLKTQLEEIRKVIIDFCQETEVNRVFGREYAITYKLLEKVGFQEDEVRAILEPEGLWERALSFDPAAVKNLLDDGNIPRDLKKKIEAIRQVTGESPRLWVKKLAGDEED